MTDWFVGTMGYGYKPWLGTFYPTGLPARQQLAYYATKFNAVEMDSTFYGTPTPAAVERWRQITPPGFIFCPKAPREITHDRRLSGVEESVDHFLETIRLLGERLGPIIFQFPPDFTVGGLGLLDAFLATLPDDLRYAVEVRHTSWVVEETASVLAAHEVCWIAADYIHLPKQITPTTDFLFLRFLGRHGRYATKNYEVEDKTADLAAWQTQINPLLPQMKAVYAFFNNDYAGYSPATANRFKALAGLPTADLQPPSQPRLL